MDSLPLIDLLTEARSYIAKPGQWVQGRSRLQRVNDAVERRDMFGAVLHARRRDEVEADPFAFERFCSAITALNTVVQIEGFADIKAYNDHPKRKHAEVLMVFDVAIARLDGTLR